MNRGESQLARNEGEIEHPVIVVIAEGKREQIGMAWIDMGFPNRISVVRISESSGRFPETVDCIQRIINPQIIIMSNYSFKGKLAEQIRDGMAEYGEQNIVFHEAAIRFFNDSEAFHRYSDICSPITKDIHGMRNKYLELSALGCLIKYCEHVEGANFATGTVQVEEVPPHGRLLMSMSTVSCLELVANSREGTKKNSLLSLFSPATTVGKRLLRSTLISPSTDKATIEQRLDSVTLLLSQEHTFFSLQALIPHFQFEKITRALIFHRKLVTPDNSRTAIANMLTLKKMLPLIGVLSKEMEGLTGGKCAVNPTGQSTELFKQIDENLNSPSVGIMMAKITEYINDKDMAEGGKGMKKGKTQVMKQQREIFAIHNGISGLLDVARATYLSLYDDIEALFEKYKENWNIKEMTLSHTRARGHYISVPKKYLENLTSDCIQVSTTKTKCTFSTHSLLSMVTRSKEALRECYQFTGQVLSALYVSLKEHVVELSRIMESVALLDMLHCFAGTIAQSHGVWCRPEISTVKSSADKDDTMEGGLVVKDGRHPIVASILEQQQDAAFTKEEFQPNDTTLLPHHQNVHFILGENNAGKSTYLRQQALIVILAQSGCYVPATRAKMQLYDRILTRLSSGDDIEGNSSSFQMECHELAAILKHASIDSLVLMDEFGRSTDIKDALALSWAAIEELVTRKASVLFATHFHDLAIMEQYYEGICTMEIKGSSMDMMAAPSTDESGSSAPRISSVHTIGKYDGSLAPKAYGIAHAKRLGFPKHLIELALEFRSKLANRNNYLYCNEHYEYVVDKLNWYAQEMAKDDKKEIYDDPEHLTTFCEQLKIDLKERGFDENTAPFMTNGKWAGEEDNHRFHEIDIAKYFPETDQSFSSGSDEEGDAANGHPVCAAEDQTQMTPTFAVVGDEENVAEENRQSATGNDSWSSRDVSMRKSSSASSANRFTQRPEVNNRILTTEKGIK